MTILENKIKKNKELFDMAEPAEGHFERFKARLAGNDDREVQNNNSRRLWRIAAVFILLMSSSFLLFLFDPGRSVNNVQAVALPQELQEVKFYYDEQANDKLQKIVQCANSPDEAAEITALAEEELQRLDENAKELENELVKNQKNERVKHALIVNYKAKSDLIDDILRRLCNI